MSDNSLPFLEFVSSQNWFEDYPKATENYLFFFKSEAFGEDHRNLERITELIEANKVEFVYNAFRFRFGDRTRPDLLERWTKEETKFEVMEEFIMQPRQVKVLLTQWV